MVTQKYSTSGCWRGLDQTKADTSAWSRGTSFPHPGRRHQQLCGDLQVSSKSNLCQEAERKEKEKQESLVKGLDEAVKEREVQGRRDYAAQQEAAVQVRREEIRFFWSVSVSVWAHLWLMRLSTGFIHTFPGRRTCWPRDWQDGELAKRLIQR